MADFDDDQTGRLLVERLTQAPANPDAPVTQGQVQDIRAAVARFLVEHHTREVQTRERDRVAGRWRAAGGLAATIALSIASYAVTLASQAAADHERLNRVEASVQNIAAESRVVAENDRDRADDLMQRGMELRGLVLQVSAILDRIEPRLGAIDERLNELERDTRSNRRSP